MTTELTRREHVTQFVRRLVTYQSVITYFGGNSVGLALAEAAGGLGDYATGLARGLRRRLTLLGAQGDDLTEVLDEFGAPRLPPGRSRVLLVLRPWSFDVIDVLPNGPVHDVEVFDAGPTQVADTLRIRSADGLTHEVFTVAVIGVAGAGPNGGTVLTTTVALVNAYNPLTEDVDALLRFTVPARTVLPSAQGATFETLDPVTVGDANPVLDGESVALSLADKTWAECTVRGARGAAAPLTITKFQTPLPKVRAVLNPERAIGGTDTEADGDARRRAAYLPSLQSVETSAWALALAQAAEPAVLRLIPSTTTRLRVMEFRVLSRSALPLSAGEKAALGAAMTARTRSLLTVEAVDVALVSVEVTATITLDSGYSLEQVWRDAASALANHLDLRRWPFGQLVDNADLQRLVDGTAGCANLDTATFTPSADVLVGETQLPYFTRLVLTDAGTGLTVGADLAPTY